jgi:hypothetical protein
MHAHLVLGIAWSFIACCNVPFGAWDLWSIHKRSLSHLPWVGGVWDYHGLALSDVMAEGDV